MTDWESLGKAAEEAGKKKIKDQAAADQQRVDDASTTRKREAERVSMLRMILSQVKTQCDIFAGRFSAHVSDARFTMVVSDEIRVGSGTESFFVRRYTGFPRIAVSIEVPDRLVVNLHSTSGNDGRQLLEFLVTESGQIYQTPASLETITPGVVAESICLRAAAAIEAA